MLLWRDCWVCLACLFASLVVVALSWVHAREGRLVKTRATLLYQPPPRLVLCTLRRSRAFRFPGMERKFRQPQVPEARPEQALRNCRSTRRWVDFFVFSVLYSGVCCSPLRIPPPPLDLRVVPVRTFHAKSCWRTLTRRSRTASPAGHFKRPIRSQDQDVT